MITPAPPGEGDRWWAVEVCELPDGRVSFGGGFPPELSISPPFRAAWWRAVSREAATRAAEADGSISVTEAAAGNVSITDAVVISSR